MRNFSRKDRANAASLLHDEVIAFEQWQASTQADRAARAKLLLQQLAECYALLDNERQGIVRCMLRGGQ